MKTWHIEDWAGNRMNYGEFKTFQDAWDYLMAKFPSDEDLQEYYAVPTVETRDLVEVER